MAMKLDELRANTAADRAHLTAAMFDLGLMPHQVEVIIDAYASPYLWRMVRQTRFALRIGLARNAAAWFMASARYRWGPPAGFDELAELDAYDRREALRVSWGACRRCGFRNCRCADGGGMNDGADQRTQMGQQPDDQNSEQDDFVSPEPG
jgi:hypothetical protein